MGAKSKALLKDADLRDRNFVYRIDKSSKIYKDRQNFVFDIGYCQICGTEYNLDSPHHALSGSHRKDDRTMICICCKCHETVHFGDSDTLKKTKEEIVEIGWQNNQSYLEYKGI